MKKYILMALCYGGMLFSQTSIQEGLNPYNLVAVKGFCDLFKDIDVKQNCGWDAQYAWLYAQGGESSLQGYIDKVYVATVPTWYGISKVCGTLICRIKTDWPARAIIEIIAVDKNYRRQGVATGLIQQCEADCKQRGIAQIYILISDDNDAMITCCQGSGFVIDEQNSNNGIVTMVKNL